MSTASLDAASPMDSPISDHSHYLYAIHLHPGLPSQVVFYHLHNANNHYLHGKLLLSALSAKVFIARNLSVLNLTTVDSHNFSAFQALF